MAKLPPVLWRHLRALLVAFVFSAILASCGNTGTPNPVAPNAEATPAHSAKPTKKPSAKPTPTKTATPTNTTGGAKFTLVFVNVGQGDAIIVKSGSWTGLIDGGPSGSETAIANALSRLGTHRLNAVVVTHPHADHTGGLSGVVYDYRPKIAYVGGGAGTASAALHSVGCKVVSVRRGQTLQFGSVKATVLSPGSLSGDANSDSVVLLLTAGGKRFLLTGDCTGPNEAAVGEWCARGPPVYLLKVAHHGSAYSTGDSFLSQTRPKYAVISVGPNSYGHPSPSTLARLRSHSVRTYTTQRSGTITLRVAASGAVTWTFAHSSKPVQGGGSSGGGTTTSSGGDPIVYITDTGECYHRDGCRYLSHSRIAIRLSKAKAEGYRPCSVCKPPT